VGLRERLRALAEQRRRFGYRRLTILLRREGLRVNHKRVYRLYREEGLADGAAPQRPGPPQAGYLFLDKAKFHASFAADVDAERAAFMADSQVPWGVGALTGTISEPAWRTKPSWYLVATEDRMIPPAAQRFMAKRAGSTVVEERGSHAIYVSKPAAVAALIEEALKGVKAVGRSPR
jgi:pimeloyl-ACP methyl ester carboxylesterase